MASGLPSLHLRHQVTRWLQHGTNTWRGFKLTTAQPAGQPQRGAQETRMKKTRVFLLLLQNVIQRTDSPVGH